jgi:hypothetical protein
MNYITESPKEKCKVPSFFLALPLFHLVLLGSHNYSLKQRTLTYTFHKGRGFLVTWMLCKK